MLADDLTQRTKSKKWDQYQQPDETGGDKLIDVPPPTSAIESATVRWCMSPTTISSRAFRTSNSTRKTND